MAVLRRSARFPGALASNHQECHSASISNSPTVFSSTCAIALSVLCLGVCSPLSIRTRVTPTDVSCGSQRLLSHPGRLPQLANTFAKRLPSPHRDRLDCRTVRLRRSSDGRSPHGISICSPPIVFKDHCIGVRQ